MRRVFAIAALVGLAAPSTACAEAVVEMSRSDLRASIAGGGVVDPHQAMEAIQTWAGGQSLDIRAFRGDTVYYRIVVKKPNGQIVSVIVDARSGSIVSGNSPIARNVSAAAGQGAARSAAGAANGNAAGKDHAAGNGGGNAGGNGNGGGNAGGNGGGNAGGNGGGNGGGHGKN